MTIFIQWNPEKKLQDRVKVLAQQRDETPEKIITEAVEQYLESEIVEFKNEEHDPLIGLIYRSRKLGKQSEEILQQDI